MKRLTVKQLAQAIVRSAEKFNVDHEIVVELNTVAKEISANHALEHYLNDPSTDFVEKEKRLHEIFHDFLSEFTYIVLSQVIEAGRFKDFNKIISSIRSLRRAKSEYVEAEITSARPLKPDEEENLMSSLKNKFDKKVLMRHSVDQKLIGGLRVVINDEIIIDSSIIGRLEQLRQKFLTA